MSDTTVRVAQHDGELGHGSLAAAVSHDGAGGPTGAGSRWDGTPRTPAERSSNRRASGEALRFGPFGATLLLDGVRGADSL